MKTQDFGAFFGNKSDPYVVVRFGSEETLVRDHQGTYEKFSGFCWGVFAKEKQHKRDNGEATRNFKLKVVAGGIGTKWW